MNPSTDEFSLIEEPLEIFVNDTILHLSMIPEIPFVKPEVMVPARLEGALSLSDDLLKAYFFEALDPRRSIVMNVYINKEKQLAVIV